MFEFDEHFAELESMKCEKIAFEMQDQKIPPSWVYLGHDIWKPDFEASGLQILHEWRLRTGDVS